MTRLIVLTFVALGWCFYVMSGGPDFEPRGLRSDQPERVAAAPSPAQVVPAKPEELVTRAALSKPEPPVEVPSAQLPADVVIFEEDEAPTLAGFPSFANPNTNITLASLEDGLTGLRQTAPAEQGEAIAASQDLEPEKDIREISGTRVNMRDGPGTIYPIITKVSIGQKVEVLSDSGTGWLRLRVLPAQQVGWVSASLVRKTTN